VSEADRTNPNAIPMYLEKHFKEKAQLKKERQMMGDTEELRQKIEEMETVNTGNRKLIDTSQVKKQREKAMESYI
jgi:uncharacterized protein YpiB (UPF0302 family)